MYEETKSSIDWKGIFLKVIIVFLIVLIGITGYKTLKGNKNPKNTTTETIAESKNSSTFTANIEKLRNAGEKYFKENIEKLPSEGNTSMITLNELINSKVIDNLYDEEGKACDVESSYVTATKEGEKTKIKANLVCGDASSYSLVYMGENDSNINIEETKKEETVTNDSLVTKTSTSKKTSTTNTSKNNTTNSSTNCNTCSTPNIKVDTNVSQKVTINKKTTKQPTTKKPSNTVTNNEKVIYYTVKFDSNGGEQEYSKQTVKENNTAKNPGNVSLRGYYFLGWYLNGVKYDFSTPVTRNITLTARFVKNGNYNDNYYYEDDYYYNDNYYDNDYYNGVLTTGYEYSYVYTMGWFEYGTDRVSINHTLRLPEDIEDIDNVVEVKIADIDFADGITTESEADIYSDRHRDTFLYDYKTNKVWHSTSTTTSSLSTILKNDVKFDYSSRYKDLDDAIDEGFDVTWRTTDVSKQCRTTFSVNGVDNLCNYGIVYRVKWEYKYYR